MYVFNISFVIPSHADFPDKGAFALARKVLRVVFERTDVTLSEEPAPWTTTEREAYTAAVDEATRAYNRVLVRGATQAEANALFALLLPRA